MYRVDGPASAFLCPLGLLSGTAYSWNQPIGITSALVGQVLGQWEASTFPYWNVSTVLYADDGTHALTMWNAPAEAPPRLTPQSSSGTIRDP